MPLAKVSNLRHRPASSASPQAARDTLAGLELMVENARASVHPAQLAEWWREVAELRLELGRYEMAMAAAQRAQGYVEILFDAPAYASLLNLQGTCLTHLGDHRGALVHFERALAQDPSNASATFNAAVLYLREERYTEAEDMFARLVSANPNDAESLNLQGVALFHLGETEKAERKFYFATTIDRNHAPAYYHLSLIHLQREEYESAYQNCSRAIALRQNEPAYWNNRGVIHASLGQLRPAINDFTRALTLDYGYVGAHLNRSLALEELGQRDQAQEDLKRALRLQPSALESASTTDRAKFEVIAGYPGLLAA
ncbi:MAG: tetratricopeptide repeat protein [Fimbriimonadaceae bacterium]|nr:tetratricopeptide repeat protein [Fimbriimonadaceae bacterium]